MTLIDRDALCARIAATQLLANAAIHQLTFGELVVFQGNALGEPEDLSVLIHATAPGIEGMPARHPARIGALREAQAAAAGSIDRFCLMS